MKNRMILLVVLPLAMSVAFFISCTSMTPTAKNKPVSAAPQTPIIVYRDKVVTIPTEKIVVVTPVPTPVPTPTLIPFVKATTATAIVESTLKPTPSIAAQVAAAVVKTMLEAPRKEITTETISSDAKTTASAVALPNPEKHSYVFLITLAVMFLLQLFLGKKKRAAEAPPK